VRLRLDDGDGVFETSDTLVHDTDVLSLTGGVQTLIFSSSDPNVQVTAGAGKTFWISVVTTADASGQDLKAFCAGGIRNAGLLGHHSGHAGDHHRRRYH
jgi:hypothetical protein